MTTMIEFCLGEAKGHGLCRVQLISSAKHEGTHNFYEKLGFHGRTRAS